MGVLSTWPSSNRWTADERLIDLVSENTHAETGTSSDSTPPPAAARGWIRGRWWPAIVVLLLAAIAVTGVQLYPGLVGQSRILISLAMALVTFLLLILWFALLAPFRWKTRLVSLLLLAVAVAGFCSYYRIAGVTGNLVPVLERRWADDVASRDALRQETAGKSADSPGVEPISIAPGDYPQFLGAQRRATIEDVQLVRDWKSQPPREVWRRPVGAGWSSFAIAGGYAITQEQRGDEEMVVSYRLATGEPQWAHGDVARYYATIAGEGPRATPTIDEGRVYTVGATGILNCLDAATGQPRWSINFLEESGAGNNGWGKSCSPLVAGDAVVVTAGGEGRSLVAYHKLTGERLWSGGDDGSGYASPMLATMGGTPQILILNSRSIAGHDPTDGRLLWDRPWPHGNPNVPQPLPIDENRLFVSSGYGAGCGLVEVQRDTEQESWTATELWHSRSLKSKFANMVLHEGTVYGLDDGIMVAVDPETGRRRWKRGRYGHGQLLLVGDLILVQAESGDLVLVEANPERLTELGRIEALSDKTWNHPAFSPPYLLVRNHKEAVCYELAVE